MKMKNYIFTVLIFLISVSSFAQEKETKSDSTSQSSNRHSHNVDPKHSVYGTPRPAEWEFQLAYDYRDKEGVPAFSFYKENQRGKTLFFTVRDNTFDDVNQYRVQRILGGANLFPINNDDRFKLDIGGVVDRIIDSTFYNKSLFSRFSWRASDKLWMRAGFEYSDAYDYDEIPMVGASYNKSLISSYYFASKYKMGFITPMLIVSRGDNDGNTNTRYGGSAMISGPKNFFLFGGYIASTDEAENVRTLAFGRSAPFRPDGLPSSFYIWKHRTDYDFHLGGLLFGKKRNNLVRPVTHGITNGIFMSSTTLRANSNLRQRKVLTITNDFDIAEYSLFYVHMNIKIPMGPNTVVNTGFTALQFYKLFIDRNIGIFNEPVIGVFYTEETTPDFNMTTMQMEEKKETFLSFQVGSKINNKFMFNLIAEPSRSGIIGSISYLIN